MPIYLDDVVANTAEHIGACLFLLQPAKDREGKREEFYFAKFVTHAPHLNANNENSEEMQWRGRHALNANVCVCVCVKLLMFYGFVSEWTPNFLHIEHAAERNVQ